MSQVRESGVRFALLADAQRQEGHHPARGDGDQVQRRRLQHHARGPVHARVSQDEPEPQDARAGGQRAPRRRPPRGHLRERRHHALPRREAQQPAAPLDPAGQKVRGDRVGGVAAVEPGAQDGRVRALPPAGRHQRRPELRRHALHRRGQPALRGAQQPPLRPALHRGGRDLGRRFRVLPLDRLVEAAGAGHRRVPVLCAVAAGDGGQGERAEGDGGGAELAAAGPGEPEPGGEGQAGKDVVQPEGEAGAGRWFALIVVRGGGPNWDLVAGTAVTLHWCANWH